MITDFLIFLALIAIALTSGIMLGQILSDWRNPKP
jgi:hypothetical protein